MSHVPAVSRIELRPLTAGLSSWPENEPASIIRLLESRALEPLSPPPVSATRAVRVQKPLLTYTSSSPVILTEARDVASRQAVPSRQSAAPSRISANPSRASAAPSRQSAALQIDAEIEILPAIAEAQVETVQIENAHVIKNVDGDIAGGILIINQINGEYDVQIVAATDAGLSQVVLDQLQVIPGEVEIPASIQVETPAPAAPSRQSAAPAPTPFPATPSRASATSSRQSAVPAPTPAPSRQSATLAPTPAPAQTPPPSRALAASSRQSATPAPAPAPSRQSAAPAPTPFSAAPSRASAAAFSRASAAPSRQSATPAPAPAQTPALSRQSAAPAPTPAQTPPPSRASAAPSRQSATSVPTPASAQPIAEIDLLALPPVVASCYAPPLVASGINTYQQVQLPTESRVVELTDADETTFVRDNNTFTTFNQTRITTVNRNHLHTQRVITNENVFNTFVTNKVIKVNDIHKQVVEQLPGETRVIEDSKQSTIVEPAKCLRAADGAVVACNEQVFAI